MRVEIGASHTWLDPQARKVRSMARMSLMDGFFPGADILALQLRALLRHKDKKLASSVVLRKKGGCKLPRCKLQGKLQVIYITYRCRPNCRVRNVDNAAKISHTRQS